MTRLSEIRFRAHDRGAVEDKELGERATHRAHERIAAAILAGDRQASRRHLRTHLEATRAFWSSPEGVLGDRPTQADRETSGRRVGH